MSGSDVSTFAARYLSNQREAILCNWTEAGLPGDDPCCTERRRKALANRLKSDERITVRFDICRVYGQRGLAGKGGDMCAAVSAWEYFDCDCVSSVLLIFKE